MRAAPRLAVVGGGVSGLTAAYLLRDTHHVTLFEAESRLGGHAHTHQVGLTDGTLAAVDSGFIVLNDRTYPHLMRLFSELEVRLQPTEMSMGIGCDGCGLGYVGGRGARGVFAQRRRLVDPRFLRMLAEVRRFQGAGRLHLRRSRAHETTYAEFLEREGFSAYFVAHYAIPVVACVWSSGSADALDYPASYLFEFLAHHGFLSLTGAPQWLVVEGGSATYVDRIRSRLSDVRADAGVRSVARNGDWVVVTDDDGSEHEFDRVVIATHADEALRLLSDPTEDEFDVLGAFGYSTNLAQLHQDEAVLRPRRSERASWNFRLDACDATADRVQVSYWMNRLQGHPENAPLVVTLNGARRVAPEKVLATMSYTHPIYTPDAVAAQRRLGLLNTSRTAFAGAYHGWGFHEDGCRSGAMAADHFLRFAEPAPQHLADMTAHRA